MFYMVTTTPHILLESMVQCHFSFVFILARVFAPNTSEEVQRNVERNMQHHHTAMGSMVVGCKMRIWVRHAFHLADGNGNRTRYSLIAHIGGYVAFTFLCILCVRLPTTIRRLHAMWSDWHTTAMWSAQCRCRRRQANTFLMAIHSIRDWRHASTFCAFKSIWWAQLIIRFIIFTRRACACVCVCLQH